MSFNIIHHHGRAMSADFEGIRIERQEHLYVSEYNQLIPCRPDDEHFIFEVPPARKRKGLSDYFCTCGSAAVVANPYVAQQRFFVCHFAATYGYHQTSVINKDDFEKSAGEIIVPKGRKWLV